MEERLKSYSFQIDSEGYSKSFSLQDLDRIPIGGQDNDEDNAFTFFERYGFVVIRDCLTGEECDKTVSEIFDIVENKQGATFKRGDKSTWDKTFPDDGTCIPQYGSISKPPIFKKQFLLNRVNPNVFKVFSKLLKNEDLMVNHDRACFFRPTDTNADWKTRDNVHLDMNPYNWMGDGSVCKSELDNLTYARTAEFIVENNQPNKSDGLQLQGVINLLDNANENDGGYVVTPGFHNEFIEYFQQKKPQYTSPSWNFDKKDLPYRLTRRITMRKGSVVVWNQQMPHGSFSNRSSTNPRMAQFIRLYPTSTVSAVRYNHRKKAVKAILETTKELSDFPLDNELTIKLLGLK